MNKIKLLLMKELRLTPKEKLYLEQRHKDCKAKKEPDRIKAVLLYSEGWTVSMISKALRLHETTINRHLEDYKHQNKKLQPESGGSTSALDDKQTQELVAHLEEHTYHHTHEIVQHVESNYEVTYSVPGMNKWLHRNGFSYKQPKGHPHKADRTKQQKFIRKYKRLKRNLGRNESILFMDSVHPSQATKLSHGWIKTGKTKWVNTTASRTRVNLVGAIDLSELHAAQVKEYKTVNAETIISFLTHMREINTSKEKIHLILDGAGYHRALNVKKAAKKLNIKLHYLPPYSPNLNPIERLWKVMNKQTRNNRFFKSAKDFRETLYDFFECTLPEISDSLTSTINDNFQII